LSKKFRIPEYAPIAISCIALLVSLYSVTISKDSQDFQKTQVLVGKTNELFLLLQKEDQLRNKEWFLITDMLTLLNEHEEILDKDGSSADYFNERVDRNRKLSDERNELWWNLVKSRDENNIYWLESNIGVYQLRIDNLLNLMERDKEFLKQFRKRVSIEDEGGQTEDNKSLNTDASKAGTG